MKKLLIKSVTIIAGILFTVNIFASSLDDDTKKRAISNQNMALNGNYKHNHPSSPGNKFKDSFTKPEKETVERNYKQQNQKKRTVQFKDHFSKPEKVNRKSYKHPQGL